MSRLEPFAVFAAAALAMLTFDVLTHLVTAHCLVESYLPPFRDPPFSSPLPLHHALHVGLTDGWLPSAFFGLFVALAARFGSWPKRSLRDLQRPLGVLFVVMSLAAVTGGAGFTTIEAGGGQLVPDHSRYVGDGPGMLRLAFVVGVQETAASVRLLGGVILCGAVVVGRMREDWREVVRRANARRAEVAAAVTEGRE
ncbi:MAG: hypothetical protein AAF532_12345 [Planctomycetota bacterium]